MQEVKSFILLFFIISQVSLKLISLNLSQCTASFCMHVVGSTVDLAAQNCHSQAFNHNKRIAVIEGLGMRLVSCRGLPSFLLLFYIVSTLRGHLCLYAMQVDDVYKTLE